MRGACRIATVLSGLVVVALLTATAVFAASSTTGPGQRLDIFVIITDSKVSLDIYALSDYGGQSELYEEQATAVHRGDVALFEIINRGKRSHGFTVFGKRIAPVKPGGKSRFTVALLNRGAFPFYVSSGAKPKALAGTLVVY